MAGITTVEGANAFLRERYMAEFNEKFTVVAAEKGTAFRRTSRTDLNWIFTVQTERIVDNDTIAIADRSWQIDKPRFRSTLAGCTVTVHEHLDGTVSIRYGPHVVGRFDSGRCSLQALATKKGRGKGGPVEAVENQTQVFPRLPPSLGNLANHARFPLFHRADDSSS